MRPGVRWSTQRWLVALVVIVASVRTASATGPVVVSPDVTIVLGANAQLVEDHDVALDRGTGNVTLTPLGTLPAASDVSGYTRLSNGDELLCFDTTVELPGPLTVPPGDVVRHSSTYTIEMAAASNGVPSGVYCDALMLDATGKLVLSFDVTAALPPSVVADDEDLVRLDAPGSWSLFVDGSAHGIPTELDLDAVERISNGKFEFSFDGSGSIGGVAFDDEDVVETDGMSWSLAYDGSAADPDWGAADLDALPEPGIGRMLGAGTAALIGLAMERARRRDTLERRARVQRRNR